MKRKIRRFYDVSGLKDGERGCRGRVRGNDYRGRNELQIYDSDVKEGR